MKESLLRDFFLKRSLFKVNRLIVQYTRIEIGEDRSIEYKDEFCLDRKLGTVLYF